MSPTALDPAAVEYPRHWEADVVLRDGSTMRIRPILPSDAAALQRFHLAQSPESVYLRFFAPLERLPERDLDRFTRVDHRDRVALVLVAGEEIVAVGRYDRIDDTDDAEVAFNVSDRAQGRGVGSVLLEHLAAAGRERGIRRFVADVLPANTRMIRVFSDAGYDVHKRFEDGVVTVDFTIRPTDRSMEVLAERERRAESLSMRRILAATSVLVYASGDEGAALAGRVGAHVEAAAQRPGGFRGRYARAFAPGDLADLTGPFDLVVMGAPAAQILELVPELERLDTGAVLILTGGFASEGRPDDGPSQRTLLRLLRQAGIRLVGPRSVGVLARGDAGSLPALLQPIDEPGSALLADDGPGIGIFCQSAHATRSLLVGSADRRLPLRTVLSAGHRADVSGNDTMQFWTADDQTAVACVHLESMGNPRKFSRVARRLAADRPVVVRVAGRSGQVRPPGHPVRTTRTPRRALEELMSQAGVLLADTVDQQLDWAMMFASQPLPRGGRVAVLTNSGTQTAILAELLESAGAITAPDVPTLNPVAAAADYARVLADLATRDDWDAALIAYGPFLDDEADAVAPRIARFAHDTGRLVLAQIHGVTGLDPRLQHSGTRVPGFATGEDAVAALRAGLAYARRRDTPPSPRVDPQGIDRRRALRLVREDLAGLPPGRERRLCSDRAAELLGAYGLEVLPVRVATTADEAVTAADELGWPVALKVADEALRHRTDLGGVRLDLGTEGELRGAFATMSARVRRLGRSGDEPAFEVQTMAEAGAACVLRAEEDPLYGPIISFGLGGDAVELLGDVSYRVPPLTEADVRSLITSVRAAPRLHGHRDLPPLDVDALAEVIARVSVLKEELAEIARVELNPVLVTESEAVVLSATVDLTHAGRGDTARRVLPE